MKREKIGKSSDSTENEQEKSQRKRGKIEQGSEQQQISIKHT
jgi:hypothetical protein